MVGEVPSPVKAFGVRILACAIKKIICLRYAIMRGVASWLNAENALRANSCSIKVVGTQEKAV